MKIYNDLQELTGHESGAIKYNGGEMIICNWAGIEGLPRQFATGLISLGEKLTAKRCAAPRDVIKAMQAHEIYMDTAISKTGFRAWLVNDKAIVVIQQDWA